MSPALILLGKELFRPTAGPDCFAFDSRSDLDSPLTVTVVVGCARGVPGSDPTSLPTPPTEALCESLVSRTDFRIPRVRFASKL
jgi:hypothetical protein